jgi:hypothetical protein
MFVSEIYDEACEILGTNENNKVFRIISQALQALMESGHWLQTTREVDICTGWDGCTVTLPRDIEIPLAIQVDGSPVYFRSRFFNYSVNGGGMFSPASWTWDDRGLVATQMDIVDPSQLIAVAEHENDVGKTIRVVGLDQHNRPLRSQLPDGTLVDGKVLQVHSQKDFGLGTLVPDPTDIVNRQVEVSPLNTLTTSDDTDHLLTNGEPVVLSVVSGATPGGLTPGQTYYVGAVNGASLELFNDPLDAQNNRYPVEVNSIVGSGTVRLTDSRVSQVKTELTLSSDFTNAYPSFTISQNNGVTFSGSTLPTPLVPNVTYYINNIGGNNYQIYGTLADAQNNTNPIYPSGSPAPFTVYVRSPLAPQTTLSFATTSYFQTGDAVQVGTNGGALPSPLITGQTYYINSTTGQLYPTGADAIANTNPITLNTLGSGSNFIVKLLPATVKPGTINNVNCANLNIPSPAVPSNPASVRAIVTGPVTSATASGGTGYDTGTPTAYFWSEGGSGYTGTAFTTTVNGTDPVYVQDLNGNVAAGSGATFYCLVHNGYIRQVTVTAVGANFNVGDTIWFFNNNGKGAVISVSAVGSGGTLLLNDSTYVDDAGNVSNGTSIQLQPVGSGATGNVLVNQTSTALNGLTLTSYGSGYMISPRISLRNVGSGTNGVATASVTTAFVSKYIVTNKGAGYTTPPVVTVGLGGSNTATAAASISGNSVSIVAPVEQGSNYTTEPTVTITTSTGAFVIFTTSGVLPAPLVAGTSYRVENPTSSGFTVRNSDFTPINITSTGSGSLYVELSNTFGVGYNSIWQGSIAGLVAGSKLYLASDYLLPTTSPSTSSNTPVYLRPLSSQSGYLYQTLQQSVAPTYNNSTSYASGQYVNYVGNVWLAITNTTGNTPPTDITYSSNYWRYVPPITVTALGVGQTYYALADTSATVTVNSNTVIPSSTQYLQTGMVVQFSSTGSFPTGIAASTDYTINLAGDGLTLLLNGSPVSITGSVSLGTGVLSMNVIRNMVFTPSTTIEGDTTNFETGTEVTVRPADGDILPPSLVTAYTNNTTLYTRRIDSTTFELYDTLDNAKSSGTTGRYTYTATGNTASSYFFADASIAPVLVKSIEAVDKPTSVGFISVYAWDYGRGGNPTLIGQYHPSETNPRYRRVRIGKNAAWVRLLYRVKATKVTSVYDYLPIEQTRALIAAIHAVDLENKDFAEQSLRYWAIAYKYLSNQNDSQSGHAMEPVQINGITYGDRTDPVMF